MKAYTKKIQDHALDFVDPTSKMHSQNTQIYITTDPRVHHLQDYKETNNPQNPHDYRSKNSTFPTETLSFQDLQQIKSSDDMLFSINTIKHF